MALWCVSLSEVCQFVAKILYFTSYFRLFKYMVSFSRYFTVYITYQPPLVHTYITVQGSKNLNLYHLYVTVISEPNLLEP
jgi:hypothetical protein